jgi:hypothetical protein
MPAKPRIIIVDTRNGKVRADGSNVNRPPEGQEAALSSIETADVLVEIGSGAGDIFVKEGATKGWVTLITTKTEAQMSMEKAEGEKAARDRPNDDLQKGDHPLKKMNAVWDPGDEHYIESGKPEERGLKGY